jgi:hypothetical protein
MWHQNQIKPGPDSDLLLVVKSALFRIQLGQQTQKDKKTNKILKSYMFLRRSVGFSRS